MPKMLTEPPGPLSKEMIQKDTEYFPPAFVSRLRLPIIAAEGKGSIIIDVDGNQYLDFTSGVAILNVGHCHPEVVQAIEKQSKKLLHTCGVIMRAEPTIRFAEKLLQLAPHDLTKIYLGNSGAEVVEAAIKAVRYTTGKHGIIAFQGSFHGRTMGALSLTASSSRTRRHYAPFLSEVIHVPYAYCYRCVFKLEYPDCGLACAEYINTVVETVLPSDDLAALVIEPILGEGGYVVPPNHYLSKIKKICEERNLVFIDDEIHTGFGRTGEMFAISSSDMTPDIMLCSSGVSPGLPLGVMLGKGKILRDWQEHGSTFGGNPLVCAAALASINVIQKEKLAENSAKVGQRMISTLQETKSKFELVGDVRGKGLMIGVELVKDKKTKEPATEQARGIVTECAKQGLLILVCGRYGNIVRFMPPLTITEELGEVAINIFLNALKKVT
jgi:4-aminobutyrate aminotransferase